MASIGIIANPASGKDIRRLVSYATTIDNNEKVNICKRIVLAAQSMGIEECVFMPETFMIGMAVLDHLENDGVLNCKISVLDFPLDASMQDTVTSAAMMEEMGVGCIVVLGGDGTSRAAAKAVRRTPILSVSTGTNNVYPTMMEGTVAGMAAATAALMEEPYKVCIHDKRIEISVNGQMRDIALIDAVVSDDFYAGAKAIWDPERIKRIMVSRCHPASIGFSAVAGVCGVVDEGEPYGLALELGAGGERVIAPIAAGVLTEIGVKNVRRIPMGESYDFVAETRGMVALDGEREVRINPGDRVSMRLSAEGPWRVIPKIALAEASRTGMFKK